MYNRNPKFMNHHPTNHRAPSREINMPMGYPPSMVQSDIINPRLPHLEFPKMLRFPTQPKSPPKVSKLLSELEHRLYNQHLQFHFMSVQTADIHSKVVSLLEKAELAEPNQPPRHLFYQKDYLTNFLEKLTTLVKEDCQDFEGKINDLPGPRVGGGPNRFEVDFFNLVDPGNTRRSSSASRRRW